MSQFTRRSFIGKTAVALGSFVALQKAVGSEVAAADRSKTDPGPANKTLDGQNPDSIWPPETDSKSLVENFKYPFSFANKRTYEGGWSREVTVRELPVSKSMAGVNMRLTAGGVRELHWHTAGEWAFMLYGKARIDLHVNNGRILEHFHEGNLTYRVPGIRQKTPDTWVEVSPELAAERGIQSGTRVVLRSRHGQVRVRALVTSRVVGKQLYMPMNSITAPVNRLTGSQSD